MLLATVHCVCYRQNHQAANLLSTNDVNTQIIVCVVWMSMSMQDPVNLNIPGFAAAEEPKLICLSESELFLESILMD